MKNWFEFNNYRMKINEDVFFSPDQTSVSNYIPTHEYADNLFPKKVVYAPKDLVGKVLPEVDFHTLAAEVPENMPSEIFCERCHWFCDQNWDKCREYSQTLSLKGYCGIDSAYHATKVVNTIICDWLNNYYNWKSK